MKPQLHRVSIIGTGSFLPGDPVPNDRIDEILGPINEAPARVQSFVKNIGSRMLANSGSSSGTSPSIRRPTSSPMMRLRDASRNSSA